MVLLFSDKCSVLKMFPYSGLESFSREPAVLKRFESVASSKILLAEILEREEVPLVVLYDTSQDDDININAACLKALQDKSFESPLKVNKNIRSIRCYDKTLMSLTKSTLQVMWYNNSIASNSMVFWYTPQ